MWNSFGFRKSPYDANPLRVHNEDVELLVGRDSEQMRLCTAFESTEQGAYVISGAPGVGKTSFLNVTQYLLESGNAPVGPRLLAARSLCAIQPTDTPLYIAQRSVEKLVKNIEQYCAIHKISVPAQTKKISKWISAQGGSGFDIGLTIVNCGFNIGRSVDLPPFTETSFERLHDVIEGIISDAVSELKLDGAILVLDNVENLEEEHMLNILLSFRDTLFTVPRVWWVIIGQSGLGSLIHAQQPRVFERISGIGLELAPISKDDLHEAIGLRVSRFHTEGQGKAPLTKEVHDHLHRASHGEIRFVFKYSNEICTEFMTIMRMRAQKLYGRRLAKGDVDGVLGNILVQMQIPSEHAESVLKQIIRKELDVLDLKKREREVLKQIGENGGAAAKEYKAFGLKSQSDFYQNYLRRLLDMGLLIKKQEGKRLVYRVRGLASLAWEYGNL